MQANLQQQIRELVLTTGKLSAIKHVMETQGLRLMAAKHQVESVMYGTTVSQPIVFPTRQPRRQKTWPFMVIGALLIASIAAFAAAWYVASNHQRLVAGGKRVRATVTDLKHVNGRNLAPIFEYESNGDRKVYESYISSSPPSYEVGDTATLFVDPDNSRRVLVDDFSHRWLLPMIFGIVGVSTLFCIGIIFVLCVQD